MMGSRAQRRSKNKISKHPLEFRVLGPLPPLSSGLAFLFTKNPVKGNVAVTFSKTRTTVQLTIKTFDGRKLGSREECSGFRVQGLGFRIYGAMPEEVIAVILGGFRAYGKFSKVWFLAWAALNGSGRT